ncbi:MAG TPA: RagB/SusD family nutrient uptake outer membrane protein [Hymenobacter sp.]|jgi:hypothetical protein|uniref:RagB/SusD family nutrient uptake outer membrane protein n=1 Tax=Hymenobacter sp. TaxID=1898978 RepID=UPI002ED8AC35
MKFNTLTTASLLAATLLASSCSKDFLDRPPQGQIVIEEFYKTPAELRIVTAGLYCRPWFEFNYPFIVDVGETMSGNAFASFNPRFGYVNLTVPEGEGGIQYGWSGLFNVVAHSNTVVNNVARFTPATVPAAIKNGAVAEARFMRATAYFYLVRIWGAVPIITDNSALLENPMVPRNTVTDVYRFIIEDLTYAAENLPATDTPGRVTSWGAKGMLSKVYLTRAGIAQNGTRLQADLDKARDMAADVVNNSKLTLMPNYYDLFLRKNENNPESLFALQWVYNGGWGSQNNMQSYLAPDSRVTGLGDGWNNISPTYDLYQNFEANGDNVRRKATMFLNADVYPELTTPALPNGYTMTATQPAFKKYVIGGPTAPGNDGQVGSLNTDINTYILRLSDVYLTHAEAILGNNASTTDAAALASFNKVRTRAGLTAATSIDQMSMLRERRSEFGMEGQFWFDLLRLNDYNPSAAIAYVSKQHRNTFNYTPAAAVKVTEPANIVTVTPTANSFKLPYPLVERQTNPKLSEEPVPYYK